MRSEILTAVNAKVLFLWAVMPYSVVGRCHHLGEPTVTTLEGGGSRFLLNIGSFSRLNDTASQEAVVLIRCLCTSVICKLIVVF
jgi:hypothetical protein